MSTSKIYKRGTKNSSGKRNVTYKLDEEHLQFLDLYVELKKEEGYHRLAYTRTDLLEEAIKQFCTNKKSEINKTASPDLLSKFNHNSLFKAK